MKELEVNRQASMVVFFFLELQIKNEVSLLVMDKEEIGLYI